MCVYVCYLFTPKLLYWTAYYVTNTSGPNVIHIFPEIWIKPQVQLFI